MKIQMCAYQNDTWYKCSSVGSFLVLKCCQSTALFGLLCCDEKLFMFGCRKKGNNPTFYLQTGRESALRIARGNEGDWYRPHRLTRADWSIKLDNRTIIKYVQAWNGSLVLQTVNRSWTEATTLNRQPLQGVIMSYDLHYTRPRLWMENKYGVHWGRVFFAFLTMQKCCFYLASVVLNLFTQKCYIYCGHVVGILKRQISVLFIAM